VLGEAGATIERAQVHAARDALLAAELAATEGKDGKEQCRAI